MGCASPRGQSADGQKSKGIDIDLRKEALAQPPTTLLFLGTGESGTLVIIPLMDIQEKAHSQGSSNLPWALFLQEN
jgi:hypothetical protein